MPIIAVTEHCTHGVCQCIICQLIDIVCMDSNLTKSQRSFVSEAILLGWERDYTDEEKFAIALLFAKRRGLCLNQGNRRRKNRPKP